MLYVNVANEKIFLDIAALHHTPKSSISLLVQKMVKMDVEEIDPRFCFLCDNLPKEKSQKTNIIYIILFRFDLFKSFTTTELYRRNRESHRYLCLEAGNQQLFCCIRPAI